MKERRSARRAGTNILLNKYIDGFPYACRAIDISTSGILVRRISEPELARETYPLEIGIPGADAPIWVWSRPVWNRGPRQALRFVAMAAKDREVLRRFVRAGPHAD